MKTDIDHFIIVSAWPATQRPKLGPDCRALLVQMWCPIGPIWGEFVLN